ncbi:cation:proton antiporter [Calycomorphotria hydatis]|uniref:High-affinity Na(+)/H(+) antiporter NhaS3 n=1 Tax=Calycomorphotria hydatis TaxID=2528027 RepID=A0A517T8U1_9PLAN|nr:cation:proton antiporter [Calycomorphotria hydatis]QDT64796.1 High-affinity Na(+)/H(+) antiporter NhaS3 [Calycomorphotria hydatis]
MTQSPRLFNFSISRYRHLSASGRRQFWLWCAVILGAVAVHDVAVLTDWGVSFAQEESVETDHGDSHAEEHGEEAHADEHGSEHGDGHGDGGHSGGHADPVAPVLAGIIVILLCAKIGGDIFERISMPAVLGELVVGILIGNLDMLTGIDVLEFMEPLKNGGEGESPFSAAAILEILAGIGVILLLFEVGLESTVRQMMSVGVSSLIVAVLGVVVPIALGYGVGSIWHDSWQVPLFIGATLCATSVGITARVLKDLGKSQAKESQIILGAAVIDDILGLIVLAICSGLITATASGASGGESGLAFELFKIVALSFGFVGGALLLGVLKFPKVLFRLASFLSGHGLLVTTALVICFGFSWAANAVGLATIVGAFAAGLILENAHYEDLERHENVDLEEAIKPLTALLVPIFFVEMGMKVDLLSFADASVWGLASLLVVAAIIGKQVCSFGVMEPGLNRFAVGLGMIPRGEVGLIFANEGSKLVADGVSVIDASTYSAIVVMVMVTTLVTPPLLSWSLGKGDPDDDNELPINAPAEGV